MVCKSNCLFGNNEKYCIWIDNTYNRGSLTEAVTNTRNFAIIISMYMTVNKEDLGDIHSMFNMKQYFGWVVQDTSMRQELSLSRMANCRH